MTRISSLFLVLGDQLFAPAHFPAPAASTLIYMAEDVELCTRHPYHKHKLILFLAAMRQQAEALRAHGHAVHYRALSEQEPAAAKGVKQSYEEALGLVIAANPHLEEIVSFAVCDNFFAERLHKLCAKHKLHYRILPSPMFLTPPGVFQRYLQRVKKPFMKTFYQEQRRRLGILVQPDGSPVGDQWSFDEDNRRRLPAATAVPAIPKLRHARVVASVQALVDARFPDHPGDSADFWLPTTRTQAVAWLSDFLQARLADFGPYEDALSTRSPWLFHSVLTPLLNTGLLTPDEVVQAAQRWAQQSADIPLNSLEGFIRQIIGWREFIRGIYANYAAKQETRNFFGHTRQLAPCWWDATTGLPPLDRALAKALKYGYNHHIERLMVISNTMLLCEIDPREVHAWFMTMYVDSADWVMGPNVYGMGQFSDGGLFATKPYICGSNYWLKMGDAASDEDDAEDWRDAIDGLYWRFIEKHKLLLQRNARLGPMINNFSRFAADRQERLMAAAEAFLAHATRN